MKKTKIKKTVKTLLTVIGIILFLMFAAPIAGGIFNIGNITGLIVSAVFLICGFFFEKVIYLCRKIRQSKKGKMIFNTVFTVFSCAALSFIIALGATAAYSTTDATDQNTVIILGCAVYGETPSVMLSARVNAAYEYLKENENASAILSGGQGNGENISEAQCMFNMLTEKGIEEKRLYLEDKSKNTYENIKNSKEIIAENNLDENIIIASSDFHLKRATMIAEKQGLTAHRISAKSGFFAIPTFYVRDTLGVIKEFILK